MRPRRGAALRELWRRGQHGWPPAFPVAQFPNAPLLVALAGALVAAVGEGTVRAYGRAALYTGLAAWAWLELAHGVNWVRRALGAAGLLLVLVRVAAAFGA